MAAAWAVVGTWFWLGTGVGLPAGQGACELARWAQEVDLISGGTAAYLLIGRAVETLQRGVLRCFLAMSVICAFMTVVCVKQCRTL